MSHVLLQLLDGGIVLGGAFSGFYWTEFFSATFVMLLKDEGLLMLKAYVC